MFANNPDSKQICTAFDVLKRCKHIDSADISEYRDIIIDMLYSKLVLGFKYYEYFHYNFENTPICDRFEFLSNNIRNSYYSKLNNSRKHNNILNDKFLAYKLFKPYYGRDMISVTEKDFDAFSSFVQAHCRFLLKPSGNYGGNGISWIECDHNTDIRALFDKLVYEHKKFICEEAVIAADYMKKLYPNSINTVRVLTYYNEPDEPVVLCALQRVGQNRSVVDNYSSGGIIASIDLDSGIINSGGVDKNHYHYTSHPDTGVKFEGFKIENWNELLSLVKQTAKLLPQVRLIGWDMAASANKGWQIIEANAHPWVEMHQFCRSEGLRRFFEEKTEWKKHGITTTNNHAK